MNILFVSAVLPFPPHSGGQVRIYNLLKQLSTRHEITLVSFIREEKERVHKKELSFCKDVHMVMRGRAWQVKYVLRAMFSRYPFLLVTYDNSVMRKKLADVMGKSQFDLVHLEPFYVWPSLPPTDLPVVVSEHNVEYEVYKTYAKKSPFCWLMTIDTSKLRKWERLIWKKSDYVTAVSGLDASVMQPFTTNKVAVVPNGVDTDVFTFERGRLPRYRVLFVGNFRWVANRDAARVLVNDIWPRIKKKYPQAGLRIVGVDIPPDLIGQTENAGGEVRQNVDDISREYQSADVLIAPHEVAGGSKFKMLEAMASGLPIVTTPEGIRGIDAQAGVHYLDASTPEDFIAKTVQIWKNKELATTITGNGRALIEKKYTWDRIAVTLEHVWKESHETNH